MFLRKFAAAVLAIVLSCALCAPAFADEVQGGEVPSSAPTVQPFTLGSDAQEPGVAGAQEDLPAVPSTGAVVKNVWTRLAGKTLYDTMAKIAQNGWSKGSGGTVVVATASGYWDALSAAGVAGLEGGAPVLVTAPKKLSAQTRAELVRIKPKKIIVAGGTSVVSDAVLSQIKAATGVAPKRIYGKTALNTAEQLNRAYAGKWKDATAILATSKSFADALSVAPISYAKHYPIFLVKDKNTVTAQTVSAMKACGVKRVIVVGGTSVVSAKCVDTLKRNGIALRTRLSGKTLYDTSREIAKWAAKNGMNVNRMGAATGKNYYDALCGAALCGKRNAALVLVDPGKTTCITSFVSPNRSKITRAYIFGGTKVISTNLEKRINGTYVSPNPSYVDATKGKVTLKGRLVREEWPTSKTGMAWSAVGYFLVLDDPVTIRFKFGSNTVTRTVTKIYVQGREQYLDDANKNLGKITIAKYQPYVGQTVAVTGNLLDIGNAHCLTSPSFWNGAPTIKKVTY